MSAPWQAQRPIKSFSIVREDIAPKGACMYTSSNAVTDTELLQSCHGLSTNRSRGKKARNEA